MDIELEKKIELLEWQRDNALRLRCPLVARKFQRRIDELARESRSKGDTGNANSERTDNQKES